MKQSLYNENFNLILQWDEHRSPSGPGRLNPWVSQRNATGMKLPSVIGTSVNAQEGPTDSEQNTVAIHKLLFCGLWNTTRQFISPKVSQQSEDFSIKVTVGLRAMPITNETISLVTWCGIVKLAVGNLRLEWDNVKLTTSYQNASTVWRTIDTIKERTMTERNRELGSGTKIRPRTRMVSAMVTLSSGHHNIKINTVSYNYYNIRHYRHCRLIHYILNRLKWMRVATWCCFIVIESTGLSSHWLHSR